MSSFSGGHKYTPKLVTILDYGRERPTTFTHLQLLFVTPRERSQRQHSAHAHQHESHRAHHGLLRAALLASPVRAISAN